MPRKILLSALLSAVAAVATLHAAGGSPLIDAVKRQDAAAVRTLLARHTDVNASEPDGSTALHWAVQRDDVVLVRQLLRAGARPTIATRFNVTPLHLAAVN